MPKYRVKGNLKDINRLVKMILSIRKRMTRTESKPSYGLRTQKVVEKNNIELKKLLSKVAQLNMAGNTAEDKKLLRTTSKEANKLLKEITKYLLKNFTVGSHGGVRQKGVGRLNDISVASKAVNSVPDVVKITPTQKARMKKAVIKRAKRNPTPTKSNVEAISASVVKESLSNKSDEQQRMAREQITKSLVQQLSEQSSHKVIAKRAAPAKSRYTSSPSAKVRESVLMTPGENTKAEIKSVVGAIAERLRTKNLTVTKTEERKVIGSILMILGKGGITTSAKVTKAAKRIVSVAFDKREAKDKASLTKALERNLKSPSIKRRTAKKRQKRERRSMASEDVNVTSGGRNGMNIIQANKRRGESLLFYITTVK